MAKTSLPSPGRAARILIVDDDADIRLVVRLFLRESGLFEVVGEAGDGREAIALVCALDPDVVLLDLDMPIVGGLEAIPVIRRRAPETRVVVLSATESEEAARDVGAHAYLRKPFDVDALVDELTRIFADGDPGGGF